MIFVEIVKPHSLFVSNHVIYYKSVTILPIMKDLAAYENVRCQ